MPFGTTHSITARITVDAVIGGGMVLRQGDIVDRDTLGDFFDQLIAQGAMELCEAVVTSDPLRTAELF